MHQLREQRAMQVMRDDDQIEHVSLQEGLAIFEIDGLRPDREPSSRCLLTQLIERRTVSIHPQRLVSLFGKPECVAAGSARQVESVTTQQATDDDELVSQRLGSFIRDSPSRSRGPRPTPTTTPTES